MGAPQCVSSASQNNALITVSGIRLVKMWEKMEDKEEERGGKKKGDTKKEEGSKTKIEETGLKESVLDPCYAPWAEECKE